MTDTRTVINPLNALSQGIAGVVMLVGSVACLIKLYRGSRNQFAVTLMVFTFLLSL